MDTYSQRLRDLSSKNGGTDAVVEINSDGSIYSYSWDRLWEDVVKSASNISNKINLGDLVVHEFGNSYSAIVANFSILAMGGCPLPLDPRLHPDKKQLIKKIASPTLALGNLELSSPVQVDIDISIVAPFKKALATSGTTGDPKIVVSQKPALVSEGEVFIRDTVYGALGAIEGLRQLIVAPLSHNMGFDMCHLGLLAGHTIYLCGPLSALKLLDVFETHRIEYAGLTPYHMRLIEPHLPGLSTKLRFLRSIQHSGSPCSIETKLAWITSIGAEKIYESYGASEDTGRTTVCGDDWLNNKGTVGKPWGCSVKIVNDDNSEVRVNQVGNIQFADPYGPHTKTITSSGLSDTKKGTDDRGYVNSEGFLFVVGRASETVDVHGLSVNVNLVENNILTSRSVKDCMVGKNEEGFLSAILTLRETEGFSATKTELKALLRSKLSSQEIPIEYVQVDEIPRNASGKLERSKFDLFLTNGRGGKYGPG